MHPWIIGTEWMRLLPDSHGSRQQSAEGAALSFDEEAEAASAMAARAEEYAAMVFPEMQKQGEGHAVLCCAAPRCAVLCCAALCCAVLCRAVLCCAVLCWVWLQSPRTGAGACTCTSAHGVAGLSACGGP